jgi:anti-sigma factor RsiW
MDESLRGLDFNCGTTQDRLPDRAAGRLEPSEAAEVDRHLAACPDCRAAFETVGWLRARRPGVPADLEGRILEAVRSAREGSAGPAREGPAGPAPSRGWFDSKPPWGWAAAAVLALAIGIPLLSTIEPAEEPETAALVMADEGVGRVWLDDDLMVAGAPAVSELSDEALRRLLEELER